MTAERRLAAVVAIVCTVIVAGCDSYGSGGGDLDCRDIGHEVRVDGADPHGLDRDGDGISCEGW